MKYDETPLLEIARLLQQHISIPIRTNAGTGSQFKHSAIGPWILVEPLHRYKETSFQARIETLLLLDNFYNSHKPHSPGARLIVRRIGIFGGFLIATQDSDIIELLPPELSDEQIREHLAEFQKFSKHIASQS